MSRTQKFGNTKDKPYSGHPNEATLRQDRNMLVTHLPQRLEIVMQTVTTTTGTHNRISEQALRIKCQEADVLERVDHLSVIS